MRLFLTLLLLVAALVPTVPRAEGSPVILIVGDSLSARYGLEFGEGWVDLLEERLAGEGYEYRIVNASISGDTTAGGRARLDAALARHSPALVIIELGGNDGLRGIPPATMKQNLDAMIRASRASGAAVALLGMRIPSNYGPRFTAEFEAVYTDLAAAHGVPLTGFFMEGVATNPAFMQADGIHPNAAGQARLLENAWPAIQAALGGTLAAAGGALTPQPAD